MIRPFTPADYPKIEEWMGKRGFPAPPLRFLPDEGFMVGDFAAGFLYETKSGGMGWVEWVTSNPEKTKEERTLALDALMFHVAQVAKELGIKALFSSAHHRAFHEVLERNGFKKTDSEMTHFVRVLQ